MKKILSVIVLVLLAFSLVTYFFRDKKVSLKKVNEVETLMLKWDTKQAFYEKPTRLRIDLDSNEFSKVSLECGVFLVWNGLSSVAQYECLEQEVEVSILGNRLLIGDNVGRMIEASSKENFDYLVNAINTLPDFNKLRQMTPSEFEYAVGLLANKWFLYGQFDEIFHVSSDSLEMILSPGKEDYPWGALVYCNNNLYSVAFIHDDPDIEVEEVAKLIASFRLLKTEK